MNNKTEIKNKSLKNYHKGNPITRTKRLKAILERVLKMEGGEVSPITPLSKSIHFERDGTTKKSTLHPDSLRDNTDFMDVMHGLIQTMRDKNGKTRFIRRRKDGEGINIEDKLEKIEENQRIMMSFLNIEPTEENKKE